MEGANSQMTMILINFPKNLCFGENGPFWAQEWCILITLDHLEEFFQILHNEKGQKIDKSNNHGLYQKNCVQLK